MKNMNLFKKITRGTTGSSNHIPDDGPSPQSSYLYKSRESNHTPDDGPRESESERNNREYRQERDSNNREYHNTKAIDDANQRIQENAAKLRQAEQRTNQARDIIRSEESRISHNRQALKQGAKDFVHKVANFDKTKTGREIIRQVKKAGPAARAVAHEAVHVGWHIGNSVPTDPMTGERLTPHPDTAMFPQRHPDEVMRGRRSSPLDTGNSIGGGYGGFVGEQLTSGSNPFSGFENTGSSFSWDLKPANPPAIRSSRGKGNNRRHNKSQKRQRSGATNPWEIRL